MSSEVANALEEPRSRAIRACCPEELFERTMTPVLGANGAPPIAVFETEPSANNFPRLPVREGEHAFVWFARFSDVGAYDRYVAALERSRDWRELVCPILDRQLEAPTEVWRLAPTARSQIPG